MSECTAMTTSAAKPLGLKNKKKDVSASARNFSYQSFSKKIASLKIDPIRRVRNYVDDEETTESFFNAAFDSWIELNLSATFAQFARELRPLCGSLPLIVHHRDRIFDILHRYIAKRDALALEPLLDLLAQFAHDLGASFEPHLAPSVALLSSLVARHVDAQTVEWTFNCLAYLLKYLSRLLVPDLRPLYDTLAPLLGREDQKAFVVRFAAEALSFLVRKAKADSLRLIVRHAFQDLLVNAARPEASAYPHGLMTMFKEACISVDQTVHSRGPQLFGTILQAVAEQQPDADGACLHVVQGVLIGLIHHTTREAFQSILVVVQGHIRSGLAVGDVEPRKLRIAASLLFTCVSARKGDRIQHWDAIGDVLLNAVGAMHRLPLADEGSTEAAWQVLKATAVTTNYADAHAVISKCSRIIEQAKDFQGGTLFLPFCEFASSLGDERFATFILPSLQKFVLSQWASHEWTLCLLIPKLASTGALPRTHEKPLHILSPNSPIAAGALRGLEAITSMLAGDATDWDRLGPLAIASWRYLDVVSCLLPANNHAHVETFRKPLVFLLEGVCRHAQEKRLAALAGKALSLLSHVQTPTPAGAEAELSRQFVSLVAAFGHNPTFLNGAYECIKRAGVQGFIRDEEANALGESLISRLASPSGDVRRLLLYILALISRARGGEEATVIIRTAATVEEIPLTMSNQRNIAMYVRKLGMDYRQIPKDSWAYRIVPHYCFGLMLAKFAPLWEEASKALAQIAESNEEVVADIAFKWLSSSGLQDFDPDLRSDEASQAPLTPFQCSNFNALEQAAERCVVDDLSAKAELETLFAADLKLPVIPVSVARAQALLVLGEIPKIAEKRTRLLVPMFLEWSSVGVEPELEAGDGGEEDAPEAPAATTKWTRQNQTAMLTLFSKFTNPKSLFRADAVYASLLRLLASGDAKIQSLALKCILTWKIPAIKSYEDQLTNMLDDTRFRDELTSFVQIDEDDSAIQARHRGALLPVLLRLLYGRSLSRKRASSGRKGMSSTRTAILAALANFRQEERGMFIDITLGELANANFVDKSEGHAFSFNLRALGSLHFSLRKQLGLVRMFEDLLKQLGSTLFPHLHKMLDALLYCVVSSTEAIKAHGEEPSNEDPIALKSLKAIRQGGLKCLTGMFHFCPTFDWKPYMRAFFGSLVAPRLDKLPVETSQGVSSLLQLFSTWASSKHTVLFLTDYDDRVLPKMADALSSVAVKDDVVLFIVQSVRRIVQHADNIEEPEVASQVGSQLLRPNVDVFLNRLGSILRKSLGKDVLEQCIETVAALAPHASGNAETTQLVDISIFLLDQPTRRVSPKTKSETLKILVNFLPLCNIDKGDGLFERTFKTVSSLFAFFRDRPSRTLLSGVLQVFAERDGDLQGTAELCKKLNAFSEKRLDEPDFDKRLEAYGAINDQEYGSFSAKQWLPLLHNMLFFIRDNEELAIRSNASYALKRFGEVCGVNIGPSDEKGFTSILSDIVLPAIRAGAREQSEIVRAEYLAVMAHIVTHCPSLEGVGDMGPLLVGGDEEASFFNNVLHIQQHRRGRALRRLAELVKKNDILSSNIAHFLLPLIEHFVFDQAEGEHNLANEAVITIGALAEQLEWQQYRALFKRFMSYIKSKPDLEKIVIRLIGTTANALSNACETRSALAAAVPTDNDGDVNMEIPEAAKPRCRLAESLPEQQKLANDISNGFLPALSEYLHQKDESTVSLRTPVAVSIVKLLRVMPEDMMKAKLPGTLTDVCHILRSRAQDSRDATRKTLAEIAGLLGPEYFSFILKELRGALLRGYQLHVLSFTVHSILVTVIPTYPTGSLDYCSSAIVDIIMDDIFGVTGSEKDAEEYVGKMKEVKSSKSYDSMDILASITTLPYLGNLIRPIQSLLQENLTLKLVRKIDELLRRINIGLLKNEAVKDRSLLVFCYEIVQEVYKAKSTMPKEEEEEVGELKKRYIVNLKVPSKNAAGVATSSHLFKLVKFSLDILRTILGKHADLMTPENMAGFIPVIGDAVLSGQEEVQISALRLLTAVLRVDLSEIDEGANVFLSKAVSFIKSSPSTNSELAQASLKLISAILRERRNVPIKDTTIGYVLTRLKTDLEEPDRQGIAFNFLKSVMARRVAIPEVYDIMDQISAIMVTNQTRGVRDSSRSLYFQFLMDYPQSLVRLKKQLAFLAKNMDYPHESGRKSVLDAIHLLITKIGDNLVQEVVQVFFIPLVMVLVNDESADCREMAGTLLKDVFKRSDDARCQTFLRLLRTWVGQDQQKLLVRGSLQVYGLFLEVVGTKGKKEVSSLTPRVQELLAGAIDEGTENPTEWELVYFSLRLWSKISQLFHETAFAASNANMWGAVRGCLRFPHAWVRLASARLLGVLFAEYARGPLAQVPLVNSRGLKLEGAEMIDIALDTSRQLNSPELTEELGLQAVKNLLFLARCFYANLMPAAKKDDEATAKEEGGAKTALTWVIGRISGVIRSERNAKKGILAKNMGKKYALQFLAAMIQVVSPEDLVPITSTLVMPLYNLVELPDASETKDLKTTSQEILTMLQAKIGTTEYTKSYTIARQRVQERRQERRNKRKVELVVDPEMATKRKERKHERKKAVRKEKGLKQRDWRHGKAV